MLIFKNEKVFFRIVSIGVLTSVIASAVIGLGLLFNIVPSTEIVGKIMFTLLTVFIAGLFLLNSISAVKVGNKLGIFAAAMLILSAILFFVLIWAGEVLGDFYVVFSYIIVSVSMVSILLDLIVGNYVRLGKSLLAVQIFFYLAFAYVELTLSFVIFDNHVLIDIWQVFVTAIIVAFTLYIVLKVKQKSLTHSRSAKTGNEEYVTITKTEYENLKAEVERLREENAALSVPVLPIATAGIGNGGADVANSTVNGNGTTGGSAGGIAP